MLATASVMLAGMVGLKLATLRENVSAAWPASAVGIWVLLRYGIRFWPAVFVGTWAAEYSFPALTIGTSAALAVGATAEALLGLRVWRWLERGWSDELREPAGALITAVVAPVPSALLGTLIMYRTGVPAEALGQIGLTWWTGNAVGVLVLLPVLQAGAPLLDPGAWRNSLNLLHGGLLLVAGAAVSWLSFFVAGGNVFVFSVFPVILLAVVWFGTLGGRVLALLLAAAGITAEFQGSGMFHGGDLNSNLLNLEAFVAAVAITGLVLPIYRPRSKSVLAVVVLLVGWVLSGWIFMIMQRDARRRQEEAFAERVAAAEALIQTRLSSYLDILQSGVGLFMAAGPVNRASWQEFVAAQNLAKRYPGINGLGVIFPVTAPELPKWLDGVRADGAADFTVKPFPGTTGPAEDVKYIITYVEPEPLNRGSLGRNIATEPSRRYAAEISRDTGEPHMNRRIAGSRDAQRRSGFLLYTPIYRRGARLDGIEQRRAAHLGWVYAQFFADTFLNLTLAPLSGNLHLDLFEEGPLARESLLFASDLNNGARSASSFDRALPHYELITTMELAGQRFRLGWRRGPNYPVAARMPVAWAAVSFTFATLLLAGLVQNLQTSRQRAQTLVDERTQELRAAQGRLRGVLDGTAFSVISATPDGMVEVFNAGAERMLGYAAQEIVGRQTPVLFHLPEEVAARAAELSRLLGRPVAPGFESFVALARMGQVDEREWTYVRKDGTHLSVLLSVTALRGAAGEIIGFLGVAVDVTARRQVQTLREQEYARLSKVGSQVPGMIYQFRLRANGSSCFPYSSEGIRQIYRVAPEDVREDASAVFKVLHPDDLPAVAESIQISARTLQPWSCEYRTRYADGTERWLLGNSVPELEPDGSVLWHGFITDVTERRRVAQALEEQEARLRLVLDEMPVGVRWVRQTGTQTEIVVNPAHERITGVTRAQTQQPGIYLERTHPDDRPAQEEGLARLRRGEISQLALEQRFLLPDGRVNWVSVSWLRRTRPGEDFFEELSTVKDVSERKEAEAALRESEERTRLFAMHAPAAVAMFDRDMRYLVASREWLRAYQIKADVIGRSHYEVFPEIGESWRQVHQRCLAGAVETSDAESFERADGSVLWLQWEVRPWYRASGEIGGIVIFTADISERKKLEESLAYARDRALEASRLKSEFMATMSHEIRTPMNAVIGMAGLLVETPLAPDQEEMARTILSGAENLMGIINDILDFSRIEAGRMPLDLSDFDPGDLVEEAAKLFSVRAAEKKLELTWEIDPAVRTVLRGDRGRVRQVINNLLGNAVKFTDAGRIQVRLTKVREAAGRLGLRCAIRDTGVGIPPEARTRLFEPFMQVDGSTTRRFGGTGLGLAISRQLVELMGGQVGFESELGRGSTFWFELDLERAARSTAPDERPAVAAPDLTTGAGRRILLAEDNVANQRVATLLLEKMGFTVAIAGNGEAALARLAAEPCDAVLMDCQMPVMDGFTATRRLRSGSVPGVDPQLPVVALTAHARAEDRSHCLEVGMNGFLTKPIRVEELRGVLVRLGLLAAGRPGAAAAPDPIRPPGSVIDEEAWQLVLDLPGADGRALAPELVALYLGDDTRRLDRLRELLSARRGPELAAEAHSLSGNAASFGGAEVRRDALQLEQFAQAGQWEQAKLTLDDLAAASQRLRAELSRRGFGGS